MNKDFEIVQDPHYGKVGLRSRVQSKAKHQYDETEEIYIPVNKVLQAIPVTGLQKPDKYWENRTRNKLS